MSGEAFALLAALAYGLAGVCILKGKSAARGDNGVFLSVLLTVAMAGGLWLSWGQVSARALVNPDNFLPISVFALAGLFSTVLGRVTMYRATERIGPVAASLLRRLTPVFALPIAVLFLAEWPDVPVICGAVLVVIASLLYLWSLPRQTIAVSTFGLWLGGGSAAFYAAAYVLRSCGLDLLPDAALGTCIGALTGVLWFAGVAALSPGRRENLRRLVVDHGPWQWLTAMALSVGQTSQFFALKSAPVVVVATIGSLEVFFAALLGAVLIGPDQVKLIRLLLAGLLALVGTMLLV